jgi:hypothetical protein
MVRFENAEWMSPPGSKPAPVPAEPAGKTQESVMKNQEISDAGFQSIQHKKF